MLANLRAYCDGSYNSFTKIGGYGYLIMADKNEESDGGGDNDHQKIMFES